MHLVELAEATSCCIEEVELVKLPGELIALLCDLIVTQRHGRLGQLREAIFILEVFGGVESHLNVTTCDGQVESLLQILLEEESYL